MSPDGNTPHPFADGGTIPSRPTTPGREIPKILPWPRPVWGLRSRRPRTRSRGWGCCVFGCVGEASRGGTPVLPAIGFFPVLITHLHVVWCRLDVLPNHGQGRYRARPAGSQ